MRHGLVRYKVGCHFDSERTIKHFHCHGALTGELSKGFNRTAPQASLIVEKVFITAVGD